MFTTLFKDKSIMRKFVALAVALAVVGTTAVAQAVPTLRYNTVNGNVFIENHADGPYAGGNANAIFNILSASGKLSAPTLPNGPIGGTAVVDTGDLPNFLALLNIPLGSHKLGAGTVAVGTPASDLTLDFYSAFGQAKVVGAVVTFIPEPATIAMAGLGMVGMIAAARRRA
jgi:hypothetical protein